MRTAALTLVLALAASRAAAAQARYVPKYREWSATPFIGSSFVNDSTLGTPVLGMDQGASRNVGMGYSSGGQFGVRVNQNLGDFWAAGLEYSFASQFLRFTNLSPTIPFVSFHEYVHHLTYDVSYLPLARTSRVRPYIDAGGGFALFYITKNAKKEAEQVGLTLRPSWELALDLGGGVNVLIQDPLVLTVDLKDRISRMPSYGLPETARVVDGQYHPGVAVHGLVHNLQLNFGFTFQWDEPE